MTTKAVLYIGDGSSFWPGVPMRDLSDEEWNNLDKSVQDALIKAGLFTVAKRTAKKKVSNDN